MLFPTTLVGSYPQPEWLIDRKRLAEAALVFLAATLFAVIIFIWWHPAAELRYPADLLFLPLVAWVAYRFTQREVALLVVLILGIAVTGTLHGRGPYHGASPWNSLPVLQVFIGILSILSITIGAVITERKAAGEALQASEHWLRESQRISRIGTYVLDMRTGDWTRSEILASRRSTRFSASAPNIRTTATPGSRSCIRKTGRVCSTIWRMM